VLFPPLLAGKLRTPLSVRLRNYKGAVPVADSLPWFGIID
jgi:hypothetical protein